MPLSLMTFRLTSVVMVAFLFLALRSAARAVALVPGELRLQEAAGEIAIIYGGRTGPVGIPSWKAVLRQDDAGNISALHIPADRAKPLGSRAGQWPLTIVQVVNASGAEGTLSRGRENYAQFRVPIFEVRERSPQRIVVHIAGDSKNRHFAHERSYVFTPEGVKIEATIVPLIDLSTVAFIPHWDRTELADSHQNAVPMRPQDRPSWVHMPSSGTDSAVPMPKWLKFPLEIELRLRRPEPTFVRVFYDKIFEAGADARQIIHNNKDGSDSAQRKIVYDKLTGITAGPVPKGARQTFHARFFFETQQWD